MTMREQLKEEGKLEGIEQGIEQGIEKTARNALQQGADIEFVAKITGLSREQVQRLQSELAEK